MGKSLHVYDKNGVYYIESPAGGIGFDLATARQIYKQLGGLLGYPPPGLIERLLNAAADVSAQHDENKSIKLQSLKHLAGCVSNCRSWKPRTRANTLKYKK